MVVQTSFKLLPDLAYAGMVGDSWSGTDIATALVGTGGVNPGTVVDAGSASVTKLTAANLQTDGYSGDITLAGVAGVVVREMSIEPSEGSDPLYAEGDYASVLKKGRVWIVAEDDSFTVGQHPYIRHTASGDNTTLGAAASSSNTGLALWTAAEVVAVDTVANLVEISINLL